MNAEYCKCKSIFDVLIPLGIKDQFYRNEILNYLKLCLPQEVRIVTELHTVNYCEQYIFIMPNNLTLDVKIWFKEAGYISKINIDAPIIHINSTFYWFDNLARFLKDKLIIGHSGIPFREVVNSISPHFIGMPAFNSLDLQIKLIIDRWQSHADNSICSCIGFNDQQNCIELLFSKGLLRSHWNVFYNKNGMITNCSIKRQCNADEIYNEIQDLFEHLKSGENSSNMYGQMQNQQEYGQPIQLAHTYSTQTNNGATLNPDQNGMIDTSPF